MLHVVYRIKGMFRTKSLLFWSFAFPLLLGTLFYFMFGSLNEMEQFKEVSVGVVGAGEDLVFTALLKEVEVETDRNMFRVMEFEREEQALEALESGEINGYINVVQDLSLTVKESSVYSSIVKTFLDQYKQNTALIEGLAAEHPEQAGAFAAALTEGSSVKMEEIPLKGQDKDPYAQYFYALIAMTCLIGTMVGLSNGNNIQANLSMVGARRNMAPMPKMKQVAADFAATYLLYCVMNAVVVAVCVFLFRQDFGKNGGLVLLGTWIGSFTGIAIGTMIAVVSKASSQGKEGICVTVFMVSSFLGGLQWGDITYLLEKNCPFINRINPATLIVNGFKSLAVFGDYRQYAVNMGTLFAIGLICLCISIWKLRRTKYASL